MKIEMDIKNIDSTLNESSSLVLSPSESFQIAQSSGIKLPLWRRVEPGSDILNASEELGYPLVLKLDAVEISHKSDQGFVYLNISNEEALLSAREEINIKYNKLVCPGDAPLLLMQQIPSGIEVIIGAKHDDTFGPVVMFGMGGVMVEVFKSVSMKICPIDELMALEMIEEVKGSQLFNGFRGSMPIDKRQLAKVIMGTAQLIEAHTSIKEIDFNPVIVRGNNAFAVDARIIKKEKAYTLTSSKSVFLT